MMQVLRFFCSWDRYSHGYRIVTIRWLIPVPIQLSNTALIRAPALILYQPACAPFYDSRYTLLLKDSQQLFSYRLVYFFVMISICYSIIKVYLMNNLYFFDLSQFLADKGWLFITYCNYSIYWLTLYFINQDNVYPIVTIRYY